MSRSCGADSIEAAFHAIFEEYERELDESLRSDLQYAGELTTNEVSRTAPKDTGAYSQGWDYAFETDGYGGLSVIVHAKKKSSLTHLLEKGHMDRAGGWVAAREHIAPAYERGAQVLERRLRNG